MFVLGCAASDDKFMKSPSVDTSLLVQTQRFTAPQGSSTTVQAEKEIYFVLDNSGSMGDEIDYVKQQVPKFIEPLVRGNTRFNLRVSDTDPPRASSSLFRSTNAGLKVISHTHPDPIQALREMMNTLGTSGEEQGLGKPLAAIQSLGVMNGQTADRSLQFPDLTIVVITDEDESTSGTSAASFANSFSSWSSRNSVPIHFLIFAMLPTSSCSSSDSSLGTKYSDFLNRMTTPGNQLYDLCKLSNTFPQLADTIINQGALRFALQANAFGIVFVRHLGQELDRSEYTLDKTTNHLVITTSRTIRPGDAIEIQYTIQ